MKDMETLEDVRCLINKELKKNVEKGSLNLAELDSVNKATEALEHIFKTLKICEEIKMMKEHPEHYSGAYHGMHGYTHSMPHASHGWECHSMNYPTEHMDPYSGAHHRSHTTGRYVSGEHMAPHHDYSVDKYSGHSINDRMVARLEEMMDSASSEFEKRQILDKIKMIRNSPDHLG